MSPSLVSQMIQAFAYRVVSFDCFKCLKLLLSTLSYEIKLTPLHSNLTANYREVLTDRNLS